MALMDDTLNTIQLVVMGHLLDDLPDGGVDFNGTNFSIGQEMTVTALAADIGLGENAEFFVMIDDEHLPNDQWGARFLQPGERVVLCPPLKGG